MSKRQLLIIIGAIMIVFLFLGIPAAGDKILAVLMGVIIIMAAIGLKSGNTNSSREQVPYVEYKNNSKPTI